MLKTYSQTKQDLFVSLITKGKKNGYFLEIGTNHPIDNNNTYKLENELNWTGIMIEYLPDFEELYKIHRNKSNYYINDARNVNYSDILEKNNFPMNIDYLQIDLDVDNKSTLDTLLLLDSSVFDKYKFATITFEHDIYCGDFFNTQKLSREIFRKRGYELVFPDVSILIGDSYKPYEDWYVHPDLVDINLIHKIKTEESLNSNQIIDLIVDNL